MIIDIHLKKEARNIFALDVAKIGLFGMWMTLIMYTSRNYMADVIVNQAADITLIHIQTVIKAPGPNHPYLTIREVLIV